MVGGLTWHQAIDIVLIALVAGFSAALVAALRWLVHRLFKVTRVGLENLFRRVLQEEIKEELEELKVNGGASIKDQVTDITEWLRINQGDLDKINYIWLWVQEHSRAHEAYLVGHTRSEYEEVSEFRADEKPGSPPSTGDRRNQPGRLFE